MGIKGFVGASIAVCCLAAVAGCGSSDQSADVSGRWQLEAVLEAGEPSPARGDANFTIDDAGRVQGDDGCGNEFETEVDGSHIGFDGFHTLAGCIDDQRNDESVTFWLVLEDDPSFEVNGERLELRTTSGSGLVLTRVPGPE